jgi:hypothetical protein
MPKKETSSKNANPQIVVIESLLEDWKSLESAIETLIKGPEPTEEDQKKEEYCITEISVDSKNKKTSKKVFHELTFRIANLPDRHLALIQIMRRDNYYRALNKVILKTLHWLPTAAKEALTEKQIQSAVELAIAWESKMQEIFKETYPNEREFRLALLDAVSKMSLLMAPGAMRSMALSGDIPRDMKWET